MANRGSATGNLPTFEDEDEACRFARDDGNADRRFWVDILDQTQFKFRVQEKREALGLREGIKEIPKDSFFGSLALSAEKV